MARVNYLRSNFNGGEVSPRLEDRSSRNDVTKAATGCRRLENFRLWVHGGAAVREGFRYIASTKDHTRRARLIPFKFSVVQAYVIEAGHQYLRFYMDGGQIVSGSPAAPYEIVSPYSEADLPLLQWTQSADILFISHPSYAPQRLTRTGHTAWSISAVQFDPMPSIELGDKPAVTVTLGSAAVGTGVTATAGAALWLAADVGREIVLGLGRASITEVGSATSATVDVTSAFAGTSLASGSWTLAGSPASATCTPSAKSPVGKVITLTLSAAGWRSGDVGKLVKVNGGSVRVTAVQSSTVVTGKILAELATTTAAGEGAWRIESDAWGGDRGWPAAVTFHQGRLWFGGAPGDPARVHGSKSDDFYNFAIGDLDDDAIEVRLAADDVHAVRWLRPSGKALAAGTDAGAWLINSGVQDPTLTPTAVSPSLEVTEGAAEGLGCVRVGADNIYLHRFRRRLMGLRYNFESDAYEPSDLTLLAQHITGQGVSAWAWQESPERTFWLVRDDGVLLSLAYLPRHDVVGWARHTTDGAFESVACIPGAAGDELWTVVRRTIGGVTKRYVERLDPAFEEWTVLADAFHVDSGLTYSGAPATTITGLGHLEGKEVAVLADGAPQRRKTVASGSITLDYAASKVHVGLPYRALLEPTDPDAGAVNGSAQGRRKRIIDVAFDVWRSAAAWYGPDETTRHLMEQGPKITAFGSPRELKTGQMMCPFNGGWDDELRLVVVHDAPLPFALRSLAMFYEVTDR